MAKKLSDHDLLVRIDERQKNMSKKMTSLCKSLEEKVDDDEEYKDMVKEHKNLWDVKNRALGYMIGAGIAGGGLVKITEGVVKAIMAKF